VSREILEQNDKPGSGAGPSGARRWTRRSLLGAAGIAAAGTVSACSPFQDDDEPPFATETPEPTPTPEVSPTPTQDVIASPVPGYGDPLRWNGRVLTVAAWGGDYQDAQREAFFEPFAAATGATIQEKVADIDELQSQVDSETVLWDVMTMPMEQMFRLARDGYLTPLNYDIIDTTALYADIVFEHGVGAAYFSTVLMYPGESTAAPTSWVDFWNTGPPEEPAEGEEPSLLHLRSLRRSPIGTLEFALLGDEAPVEDLYPLDLDRAFASLDRIRDQVIVWWQESKEPIELISAAQVGMASAYSPRLDQLDLGSEIRVLWYQGMLSADAWVIPLGAENADLAMDFISYATRAIPAANFSRLVPYGPVNAEAFDYLRRDRADILPSSPTNKAVQFVEDWDYWSRNLDEVTLRFEEWLLAAPEGTPESITE
jgi:putative spermidine/putrescine transport system substrate-binding protein